MQKIVIVLTVLVGLVFICLRFRRRKKEINKKILILQKEVVLQQRQVRILKELAGTSKAKLDTLPNITFVFPFHGAKTTTHTYGFRIGPPSLESSFLKDVRIKMPGWTFSHKLPE